jgi:hypothetical protein
MGRRIGRGLLPSLLLVAFLRAVAPPPLAAQSPHTHDALAPLPKDSYPTHEEILPFWMSLLRMEEASVYRVGPPTDLTLLDTGRDSVGFIAGSPILGSARVVGEDWLDSLRTIVGNPMSYRREAQMQLVPPEYVIRLRGEEDSMTVMTGAKGSFLYVRPSSGPVIAGWIDKDRAKLAALIDEALPTSKPQPNPARTTRKRPPPTK